MMNTTTMLVLAAAATFGGIGAFGQGPQQGKPPSSEDHIRRLIRKADDLARALEATRNDLVKVREAHARADRELEQGLEEHAAATKRAFAEMAAATSRSNDAARTRADGVAELAARTGVPVGGIIPYVGDPRRVPRGWQLCDGSRIADRNSPLMGVLRGRVPDLRGRVVRGSDSEHSVRSTCGSDTVTLPDYSVTADASGVAEHQRHKDSHLLGNREHSGWTLVDTEKDETAAVRVRVSGSATPTVGRVKSIPRAYVTAWIIRIL